MNQAQQKHREEVQQMMEEALRRLKSDANKCHGLFLIDVVAGKCTLRMYSICYITYSILNKYTVYLFIIYIIYSIYIHMHSINLPCIF